MPEGGLVMDVRSQRKLELVHKVAHGVLSVKDAAQRIGVSERTMFRYLEKYKSEGFFFLKHGNIGKKPVNRIDESLKQNIIELLKGRYFDFNVLHAREMLWEEFGIEVKRETLRKICHKIGIVKRAKKRRSKVRRYRDRSRQAGLLVQMDGSYHKWFGQFESCLIAVIDDATSEVLHAEFSYAETTFNCFRVLKEVILRKGLFRTLYVDKAGVYGGSKRVGFSHVKRGVEELGSYVLYAHSPEAKGRIERLFGTLQDRLVAEMRLKRVKNMEQANIFLQEYIHTRHNPKFQVKPINDESAFIQLHPNINLDEYLSVKEYRKVARDHTISIGADRYLILNNLKYSIHNSKVLIRWYEDKTFKAYFGSMELKLGKIKRIKKLAA